MLWSAGPLYVQFRTEAALNQAGNAGRIGLRKKALRQPVPRLEYQIIDLQRGIPDQRIEPFLGCVSPFQ